MGLLSFFQRQPDADAPAAAPAAAAAEPDAVAAARARARRRLLGATVLLGLGVIGFPLLFETQPRPIAVDIPIDIPRKDNATPLALPPPATAPPSRASAAKLDEPAAAQAGAERRASTPDIVERAAEQGRELGSANGSQAAGRPTPATEAKVAGAPAVPASKATPVPAPASRPAAAPARPAPSDQPGSDDGARAKALLEGQPAAPVVAASATAGRVVVQVGAYTDAAKLAEARRKLEAMGFKTYTQVVDAEGGQRTRVRVGPFAGRAEADKVAARVKAAGLPAAILTL